MKIRWPSKESIGFGLVGWGINIATGTPIGTFIGKGSEIAHRSVVEGETAPDSHVEANEQTGEQIEWFNFPNRKELAHFEQRAAQRGVPIVKRDGLSVAVEMTDSHKLGGKSAFEGQDALEVGADLGIESLW